MLASPINLHAWIEENRHLLKPPVGNKMIDNGDFIVMVVGGPNAHRLPLRRRPEWFYQLEGEMVLKVQATARCATFRSAPARSSCCRARCRTRRGARRWHRPGGRAQAPAA
jgi:hypothetical protein